MQSVYVHHICAGDWKGQKRASNTPELELQMASELLVSVGNGILVLCKHSKCS